MGVISDAAPGPVEALKIALASSGVLQVIACLSGNFEPGNGQPAEQVADNRIECRYAGRGHLDHDDVLIVIANWRYVPSIVLA